MGHDVYVIDYQQPFMVEYFHPKRYWGIRSFVSAFIHGNLQDYLYQSRLPYVRNRNFKIFKHRYLRLTDKCYDIDDIPSMNLYIVGSDQPWNPDLTAGPDLVYYGQFKRPISSRLISYAISGSEKAFSKVGWDNVKRYCENFDALSFREESITHKFEELTGRRCETVLDPTLLTNASLWESLISHKWANRKYLLLYHVGGPKGVIEAMTTKARQVAAEQGIDLIDASRYLYSPSDFVSLIYYATFVITASFHAMAFSIIFQKRFCVVRTGQASDVRFESLLKKLDLINKLQAPRDISISEETTNKDCITNTIDYYRNHSISFIKYQIQKH